MSPAVRPRRADAAAVPPHALSAWKRHVATLALFALVFVSLEVFSYTRESATWDEPVHVMDGYLSLVHGDFRADIEHPPLMRLWAALPLVSLPIYASPASLDRFEQRDWALRGLFVAAHRFMYVDNDADRLLYRARFMSVLLGVALGILVYAWAASLFGWATAVAVLALYCVEPNIASHARLVTTDFGVTLAIFGAVFFLWRATSAWSRQAAAGVVCFTALAITAKYSGLLVMPILLLLLALSSARRTMAITRAAALFVAAAAVSVVAIWASYGFRYAPSATEGWRFSFHADTAAVEMLPFTTAVVRRVDDLRLLPNAYSEGLILNRARSFTRKAFLAGDYRETGWWYYFPVAVALKTPLALLVLAGAGAWTIRRQRDLAPFLVVPIVVVLGAAMLASINIGVRHVLPLYPFLLMLAGAALHQLVRAHRVYIAGTALLLAMAEPLAVYPHTLAFFNVLAGGPSHGSEFLADSNIDWGQDLKGLKAWLVEHQVAHVNLAYFGFADPRYYGIDCTFLPGAPVWVTPELVRLPRLPGYVAISATALRGVYAENPREREFYTRLARLTPIDTVGYSIFIYRIDRPWYEDLRLIP